MLGRAEGVLNTLNRDGLSLRMLIISVRTWGVAVAVKALMGTNGSVRLVLNQARFL
jgi:hypothetical protein